MDTDCGGGCWDDLYLGFHVDDIPCEPGVWPDLSPELERKLCAYGHFMKLIGDPKGKKVLSIGSGIDAVAVQIALQGANVTCMDVSRTAASKTMALASRLGVKDRIEYVVGRCEEMEYDNVFDLVVSRRALHHMDFPEVMRRVRKALVPGGSLVAEEPVCLTRILRAVHKLLPLHPNHAYIDGEVELTERELTVVRSLFSQTECLYFDLVSRNMTTYILAVLGLTRLVKPLRGFDRKLLEAFPSLEPYSTYVVLRAVR